MRRLTAKLALLVPVLGVTLAWGQPTEPTAPTPNPRPYLGVSADDAPEGGVRVVQVHPNSPAATAGLQPGDILTHFGGQPLQEFVDLSALVLASQTGDEKVLRWRRGEENFEATLTLGTRPATPTPTPAPVPTPAPGAGLEQFFSGDGLLKPDNLIPDMRPRQAYLGLQLQPIDAALRSRLRLPDVDGVLVAEVIPGSPADVAGVRSEDVILQVDGLPIRDPQQIVGMVAVKRPQENMIIQVSRATTEGGQLLELTVTLTAPPVGTLLTPPATSRIFPAPSMAPYPPVAPTVPPATDAAAELDQLRQRIANLENDVQQLRQSLQAQSPMPTPPAPDAPAPETPAPPPSPSDDRPQDDDANSASPEAESPATEEPTASGDDAPSTAAGT